MPSLFMSSLPTQLKLNASSPIYFWLNTLLIVTSVRQIFFFLPFWASVSHLVKECSDNTGLLQESDEKIWMEAFVLHETMEYLNKIYCNS